MDRNECDEYKKQEIICQIMSENNVTFAEAKFIYRGTDILDDTPHTMAYFPQEFPDALKCRENEIIHDTTRNKSFLIRGKYATVARQEPPKQRPSLQAPTYPRELLYRASQYPMKPIIQQKRKSEEESTNEHNKRSQMLGVPLNRPSHSQVISGSNRTIINLTQSQGSNVAAYSSPHTHGSKVATNTNNIQKEGSSVVTNYIDNNQITLGSATSYAQIDDQEFSQDIDIS